MTATSSDRSVCARIAQRLAGSLGDRRYRMWFDRTARLDFDEQSRTLQVAAPNRFVADWISRHFDSHLRQAAQHELGPGVNLRVEVSAEAFAADATTGHAVLPTVAAVAANHSSVVNIASPAPAADVSTGNAVASTPASPSSRRHSNHRHDAVTLRHRLHDFVVGPSNELAFAAAQRLAQNDTDLTNPLFIHGGCGLGKTHLLQGICRGLLDRKPDARVLYVTGEQFTNDFLTGIRTNKLEDFRRRIRKLDLLAIDDVHFIANKQATQQEFLHSFDAIDTGGARVVMASDAHPRLIKQFSEALISRCVRGMVVEVRPPDTATRIKIIRALAQKRGLPLMETVVEVIAARCIHSVRDIEGTLTKLEAVATLLHQRRIVRAAGTANAVNDNQTPRQDPRLASDDSHDSASDANTARPDAASVAVAAASTILPPEHNSAPHTTSNHDGSAPPAPPIASREAATNSDAAPHNARHTAPIGHAILDQLFAADQAAPSRAVRFDAIVNTVADQLGVTRDQIAGPARQPDVVLARGMAIHLARRLTRMSYPEIAAGLGKRNHSTIITAAQRVEHQIAQRSVITIPGSLEQLPIGELAHRLHQAVLRAPAPAA